MPATSTIFYIIGDPTDCAKAIQFLGRHNVRPKYLGHSYQLDSTSNVKVTLLELKCTPTRCEVGSHRPSLESKIYVGTGRHAMERALSSYILSQHTHGVRDLSCRPERNMLTQYLQNGSPNLSISPRDWIAGNRLFSGHSKDFFLKLTDFVLNERGMFLKIWSLDCQKNYWNSSLNGGLPITKKRDVLHEGTFLLHDLFHFLFSDPVVTGDETAEEVRTYIAYRMMSEACSQVLADMVGVGRAELETVGYDTTRRRIYPVLAATGLDASEYSTAVTLMHANSLYCLTGDDSPYRALGITGLVLEKFTEKYSVYFSVDFEWNYSNISHMIAASTTYDRKGYISSLPPSVTKFTVHSLYETVRNMDGTISFEKLFGVFVKQFDELLAYDSPYSAFRFAKVAAEKYLAGQILIAYLYPSKDAEVLISVYSKIKSSLNVATQLGEVLNLYEQGVTAVNAYIDELGKLGILLPHEVKAHKLHVAHFPPVYYSYDLGKDSYISHKTVANRILGHTMVFPGNI